MRHLRALARPSCGFAILAVDRREGLRAILAQHQPGPVSDSAPTDKLKAMSALTPHAFAMLIDGQFA